MKKEGSFQNVPVIWYIVLPLIAVFHKVLGMMGWLERGGWPNFIVLIGVFILWIIIVLRETDSPLSPLVWLGSLYGILAAAIDFIYWLNFKEPLGLGEHWSFDDLLTAIGYYLSPGIEIIGNIMLGVLIGIFAGFIARIVRNIQKKRD